MAATDGVENCVGKNPCLERIRPVLKTGLSAKELYKNAGLPNRYATRFLRRIRNVLAPNGSSSNAPAITVVASGTATT